MKTKSKPDVESISGKFKKFRKEKNISFDWLANQTGYSQDYLRKLEDGEIMPAVGTIIQIAKALDISSDLLLSDQKDAVNRRIESYVKRTEFYAYKTLSPGAENKHLKAFLVTIEAMQEHVGAYYQHEGEEFIFVLKGHIEVSVGEHVNALGRGESLHFNSAVVHKLKNVGSENAELLVVVYTP
jgi:quercetin dioxygenase-like cupin family protein